MGVAIDILQSFVIAGPGVEIDRRIRPLLEIIANIADRIVKYRKVESVDTKEALSLDCVRVHSIESHKLSSSVGDNYSK